MVCRKHATKLPPIHALDVKPYSEIARQMLEMADQALERYGEPNVSLAGLRRALDKQLSGIPLSVKILRKREAGF